LHDETAKSALKRGTRRTLIHVLDQALKLLHPILPFITEEIWQRTKKLTSENNDSIMRCSYPSVASEFLNPEIEAEIEWVQKVIQAIRTIRSEMNISPAKRIPCLLRNASALTQERINKYTPVFVLLSKLSSLTCLHAGDSVPASAAAVIGETELLIPMSDLIDRQAELIRLEKELSKLDRDIALAESKLNNTRFTDRAPAEIIRKEKEKLQLALEVRAKLVQQKNVVQDM
jgi:valyl-tRNA synthetase